MTINTITIGRQVRLLIGSNTVCFARFVPAVTRELIQNADGTMCGDRVHPVNRVRKGRKIIRGTFTFDFTGAILSLLVPKLGLTDLTGGVYEVGSGDSLVEFDMKIDMGATTHYWTNCVVMGWSIRGAKGGSPMKITIDVSAEDETDTSSFSNNPLAIKDIFAFVDLTQSEYDSVGTGGTPVTLSADRFLLQVDNGVVVEHNSSVTRTGAKEGAWSGVIATSTPYLSSNKFAYWQYRDSEGPIASTIEFQNDDTSLLIEAPACVPITSLANVISKIDQVRTPITLQAQRTDNAGTRVAPLTLTIASV